MHPEFDELVDRSISESLAGEAKSGTSESENQFAGYQHLASEMSRVLTEESPRLTGAAQARHLAQLRERAASKRGAARPGFGWLLRGAPRWAQVAAIAIVVVIAANGITVASASSLPGSPLYPFKRLAEQSNVLLAPTAGERARIWMDLASLRLDEVQRLLAIQPRVDPQTLDDIDESILRALTEIAGTRGTERIALLRQIIQLALREQSVLDQLAQNQSSDDRARFQQTSRLMQDVAHIAGSAQSNQGSPGLTPTGTATATVSPSASVTPTGTMTATPVSTSTPVPTSPVPPTNSPSVQPNPTLAPGAGSPGPSRSQTPQEGQGPGRPPSETPEGGRGEPPGPSESDTPEPQKTGSPGPEKAGASEAQNTASPNGHESDTRQAQDTSAPHPHQKGTRQSQMSKPLPPRDRGAPQPRKTRTPAKVSHRQ